jgi:hypothetical protein
MAIYFYSSQNLFGQQAARIRLIDSRSNNGIAYAHIKVPGKNILEVSDADGFFSLLLQGKDSVQISHVAYKTLKTTFGRIKDQKFIEMEELPIEIDPIYISANNAKKIVEKAIDSSYKVLNEPMYFKCYRKDQLFFKDTLISEAKAEIQYRIEKFLSPSHGELLLGYLKNIIVYRDSLFKSVFVPPFSMPSVYAPINRFIVGVSKTLEAQVYFTNLDINDSLIMVSINPRLDFKPNKKYMLKYGRFIIDKRNWRILRIDTNLSPEMMAIGRSDQYRAKDAKYYPYHYSYSHFYGDDGFLSKVVSDVQFSYLENNPEKIWHNHSELVFINEKKKFVRDSLMVPLKRDSSLIQMNSRFSPGFEEKFNSIIPPGQSINN